MIPEFAIREWNEVVPWTESEQVEQDLLICRALTEIYKDEYLASHLAFRGGTALHNYIFRHNLVIVRILTWFRLKQNLLKRHMTILEKHCLFLENQR